MEKIKKRGVSAIIAAVLLILIVIVAAVMLWLFLSPMINDSFSTTFIVNMEILDEGHTLWSDSNRLAKVQVWRGVDDAVITGYDLIFDFEDTSLTHTIGRTINKNTKTVHCINLTNSPENLLSIKLAPIFENQKRGNIVSELRIRDSHKRPLTNDGNCEVVNYGFPEEPPLIPECENDNECPLGETCVGGVCVSCTPDKNCADYICGTELSDGCNNILNCPCPSGKTCVGGVCIAGTTYFVNHISGNDANDGSETSPWKTMDKVNDSTEEGDLVYLMDFSNSTPDWGEPNFQWPQNRNYYSKKIHQYGITWTFDNYYNVGRFVNGDFWVVGPTTIISINPRSENVSERIKNGAMVNPNSSSAFSQGYDNLNPLISYKSSLNVARPNGQDLSSSNSLVLPGGSSLISTISWDSVQSGGSVIIKDAAVLTILSSPAPNGSFRPAYSGNDKSIRFNKNMLNYSLLKNLAPVSGIPEIQTIERYLERPWLDHSQDYMSASIHPTNNMPWYGRNMALNIGEAALMLNLDFTNSQKEKLLINLVQLGIDNFGIIESGGIKYRVNNGGFAQGRKFPILFAGLMLNNNEMKSIGQKSGDYLYSDHHDAGNEPVDYIHFGEDDQTFYVFQSDINRHHNLEPQFAVPYPEYSYPYTSDYSSSDLGLPEWGITHSNLPARDTKQWSSPYRWNQNGASWGGYILAIQIMGEKDLWNHDALFDYTDRFMEVQASLGYINDYRRHWVRWTEKMWDEYRKDYGCVWTRDNLTDTNSNGHYNCSNQMVRCSWQNSSVGTLITECSHYPNQRARDYDPCNLGC